LKSDPGKKADGGEKINEDLNEEIVTKNLNILEGEETLKKHILYDEFTWELNLLIPLISRLTSRVES